MLKTKFGEVLEHIATGQNSEYIANIGGVSFHGMEAELLIKFANLSDEQDARTLRHIMKKADPSSAHWRFGLCILSLPTYP